MTSQTLDQPHSGSVHIEHCAVYILLCKDDTTYTGITNNVCRRFHQHNTGKVAYTRTRKPVELVCTILTPNRRAAAHLEKRIKKTGALRWLRRHYKDVNFALEGSSKLMALLGRLGLGSQTPV